MTDKAEGTSFEDPTEPAENELDSIAGDGGARPKRCTTCRRLVKNHDGPCGKNCKNSPEPETYETYDSEQHPEDPVDRPNAMMRELVTQLTQLNLNMTVIQQQQTEILKNTRTTHSAETADTTNKLHISSLSDQMPTELQGLPVHVSAKTVTSIVSGEYVNMSELLPYNDIPSEELLPVYHRDGTMSFQPKRSRKYINDFDTWLVSWSIFEAILMHKKPELYSKLCQYRMSIQKASRKYNWYAVMTYDKRFRTKLAETRSFSYDTVDSMAYVSTLDAAAVRTDAKQCHRCKSLDHLVSDCPFPPEPTMAKDPRRKESSWRQKPKPETWYFNSKEGCNNWQFDNCRYPGCKRAHVCKGCRGPVPLTRCSTCNNV